MNAEDLIKLEQAGDDRFTVAAGSEGDLQTFGGVTIARLLAGAAATVDGAPCHSLHALFLREAKQTQEIALTVERLRDGRSFKTRRIEASQTGRTIAVAHASFHAGDEGPSRQPAAPSAPDPDAIEDQREMRRRRAIARGQEPRRHLVEEVLDLRSKDLPIASARDETRRLLWFRNRRHLSDAPALHQAIIAMASDIGLVHTALLAHNQLGDARALETASLDHAIWFHRAARADESLMCDQSSPMTHAGRGLSYGRIFDRNGALVASVAQEVLVRDMSRVMGDG